MTNLKYRIWIPHLQVMTTQVFSIHPYSQTVEVWLTSPDEGDPHEFDFSEVVIMQYTGMTDIHGTEIFEGDIVNALTWGYGKNIIETGKIYWNAEKVCWDLNYYDMCGFLERERKDYLSKLEIIGNTYQKQSESK